MWNGGEQRPHSKPQSHCVTTCHYPPRTSACTGSVGAPGLQKKVHKGLEALTWCRGLRSRRGGAVGLRFMTWAPNIQCSLKESLCATPVGKTEGSLGTRAQAFDFEGLQGRCFFLFLLVFRLPTDSGRPGCDTWPA